eukprot:gene31939-8936_t
MTWAPADALLSHTSSASSDASLARGLRVYLNRTSTVSNSRGSQIHEDTGAGRYRYGLRATCRLRYVLSLLLAMLATIRAINALPIGTGAGFPARILSLPRYRSPNERVTGAPKGQTNATPVLRANRSRRVKLLLLREHLEKETQH